jgi:hypothetical protein
MTRWPELRDRWHACGPGRTWHTVCETLGSAARVQVALDYQSWLREVVGPADMTSGATARSLSHAD